MIFVRNHPPFYFIVEIVLPQFCEHLNFRYRLYLNYALNQDIYQVRPELGF